MIDCPIRRRCVLLTRHALFAVLLAGCASVQNTPKQDYTSALLTECVGKFPGTGVKRVESDGRWWITYDSPSALAGVHACMAEQYKAYPYFDWVKARQASTQSSSGVVPPTAGSAALSGSIAVPVWTVGDEWQYAYKSPSDSGTYVWSVNRLEMLDGVQHYVIKSGTREIFYRVSDLATSLERVDGVVVVRHTPPRLSYSWPLTAGKTWEQDSRDERPVDRQNTNRNSVWVVDAEETVAVPAGPFRTLKIVWRNRNTNALLYEMWYAPAAKQWVKIREVLTNGIREREMIEFKVR